MKFPTEWKVIKFHGSSHHQPGELCSETYKPGMLLDVEGIFSSTQLPAGSEYPLVNVYRTMENHHFSLINGDFPLVMLNYQRVSG
jgi:hypothetical protein